MIELVKKWGWAGSAIAFVIGATWGLLTYQHQARLGFQNPMVQKTIELCYEVSDVVGRMTDEPDQTKWTALNTQFWSLYWGRLVLIENEGVARAMVDFKRMLDENGFDGRKKLDRTAYQVSLACRDQIEALMSSGWKLDALKEIGIKN